ncbi:hypothetical protein HK096_005889, partial [Nowakowskiella sp. JEL0078]
MFDKKAFFSKKPRLTSESSETIGFEFTSLGTAIKNASSSLSLDYGNSDSKPLKFPLPMSRVRYVRSNQSLKLKTSPEKSAGPEYDAEYLQFSDSPAHENEITNEEAIFIKQQYALRHRPVELKSTESTTTPLNETFNRNVTGSFVVSDLYGNTEKAMQHNHTPRQILRTLTHLSPQITDPFFQSVNNGQYTKKFSAASTKFSKLEFATSSTFPELQPEDRSFSKDKSKEPLLFLKSKERGFLAAQQFDQLLSIKEEQSKSDDKLQITSVTENTALLSEESGDHLIEEDSVKLSVLCGNSSILLLKSLTTSPNDYNFSELSENFEKQGSNISVDFASTGIDNDFNKSPSYSVSVARSSASLVARSDPTSIVKFPAQTLLSFSPKSGILKSENSSPSRQKNTTLLINQSDNLVNLDKSHDLSLVSKSYIQESNDSFEIHEKRGKSKSRTGGISTMRSNRDSPGSVGKVCVRYHEEIEDNESNVTEDNEHVVRNLEVEIIENGFGQAEQEDHDLTYYKLFEVMKGMKCSITLLESQMKTHLDLIEELETGHVV